LFVHSYSLSWPLYRVSKRVMKKLGTLDFNSKVNDRAISW